MRGLFGLRPRVLALIDLMQDIDVILPVILALRADGRFALSVRVSRWLSAESPRTAALLRRHALPFRLVRRTEVTAGAAPSLRGVAAVICASESSHPAHAAGHALAGRASTLGIRSYALQHGFENVGLFGVEAGAARFASDVVFCWFPEAARPADLPGDTAARLAHVGRPLLAAEAGAPPAPAFDLGVFENLHWDRYDERDRQAFRQGLFAVASAMPRRRILLHPHPAGRWADGLSHELAPFGNITRVSADEARARPGGGAALLQGVRRVITTPSTVALDAAQLGRPTALAAAGGDPYRPLPVLSGPQDWVAFASAAESDGAALDQFLSRVLVAGDAAPRILERLGRDLLGESGTDD